MKPAAAEAIASCAKPMIRAVALALADALLQALAADT